MAKGITEQQKKLALAAIAACIILYVDFAYLLKLQLNGLRGISRRLRQAKDSLRQYDTSSSYYRDLEAQLSRLKDKFSDFEKYVYSEPDLPLLLDDIAKKANSLDVKIMQVSPQSGQPEKAKGADKAAAGSNFHPLLLEFELACGYHQLGKFISALESNPLIEVIRIKIASDSQEPTNQKAGLILKIYAQKK